MPYKLSLTPAQKYALRRGKTVMAKRRGRPGRYRRKPKTAPRRALSTGYKGAPNQFRFIRETAPFTLDIGDNATPGVSIIAGTGAIPNTSMYKTPSFKMSDLPGYTEFAALFASFKVDSISLICVPQWTANTQPTINPLTAGWAATAGIPNLMITRVNTKYLPQGYAAPATAEASRDKLSQIVRKSRSLFGNRKWLKLVTTKPPVLAEILAVSGGATNEIARPQPWIPTADMPTQEFVLNDLLFADRLNGTDHLAGVYLYRCYFRVNFRCSFLG